MLHTTTPSSPMKAYHGTRRKATSRLKLPAKSVTD